MSVLANGWHCENSIRYAFFRHALAKTSFALKGVRCERTSEMVKQIAKPQLRSLLSTFVFGSCSI